MSRTARLPVREACVEVTRGSGRKPWRGRLFDRVPPLTGGHPLFWVEFTTGEIAPLFRQDFKVVRCATGYPDLRSRLPVAKALRRGPARVHAFKRRST